MTTPSIAGNSVTMQERHGGTLWVVRLAAPKANVLDSAMIEALTDAFKQAATTTGLKAVVLEGKGPNFSFGASVEEHLPEKVGPLLQRFNGLFRAIANAEVPVLAAVRGCCLGGGLELAAFCHRLFASPDAKLGQPEIALGVFAPAASAILAARIGQSRADDLCLSARVVDAAEAKAMGLVDEVTDDPSAAAAAWAEEHLLPRSASSLRFATRASRLGFLRAFDRSVEELTRLYLDELMKTSDAVEGIRAFLEKREPVWSDE